MNKAEELRTKYPSIKNIIHESSKIWHRKFPCKVKFDRTVNDNEVWYWLGAHFSFPMPITHEKFRFRSGKNITVYFESISDTEKVIQYFNTRLLNVSVLPCKKSTEVLEQDKKVRLKKQLYFNQYKHKIRFNYKFSITEDRLEEIKKWVHLMFDFKDNPYRLRNDRVWFRWNQREPAMFLTNDEDVTLVKLAWGEYFNTIESIQLISELE